MIQAIAFDLDDTLLDTTGLLVPKASADAFNILIKAGLKLSLPECEKFRLEMIKETSHKEVIEKLADNFGTDQTRLASNEAVRMFYEPNLPDVLPLLPGARENLNYLKPKYKLFLVTAGADQAQRKKAQALGINKDFERMYVVNSLDKERKKAVFEDIIKNLAIPPENLLCVGNSLSSEIHDGLLVGAKTCYFEFGEDRGHLISDPRFKPHFHIRQHSELISTCRL
ncbi:MAG: HAD hydrolase-like protein [Bdellovibrionaceae bacterium]|nr:HAD hydrolase-like protein [Bdellovibrio sp.]